MAFEQLGEEYIDPVMNPVYSGPDPYANAFPLGYDATASFGATSDGSVQGTTDTNNTTNTTYTDPYAQWGGTENYNNLLSGYDTQIGNVYDTAGESATSGGSDLNLGISGYLDQLKLQQKGINNQAVNNELAFRQGRQGVQGMVGRGIRSGGVLLSNRNAADSSAAQAIARAYGDIGRRQLSSVGNQYALQNRNIDQSQEALNVGRSGKVREFEGSKSSLVNNIVSQARQSLAAIEAEMEAASLPDRIDLEQAKERVKSDALDKLAFLDQKLGSVNAVAPTSLEQRRAEALGLASAGEAPEESFNFTTQVPAQFQGSGLPSEFPIFGVPRSKRTQ